ncbi:hypothetical protein GCM10027445_03630 [Amycolatopsis endophytica]|uniref:Pimeloyl-ACP methyl ester carboxylesterase n=1 Tax=Amycolatopsis endophytica TaxID=860233 RepID=A0A853B7L9_9PSEU|nr:hypothetical protein [Amycolatopsis endophytica]NYI91298.1 pimeloyl-ACP methyl ester carboxylesterase [Amycolatopsis endophytica]
MPAELRRVRTNGIETTVAMAGAVPAVLLLHGFQHTWQVWREIIGVLATRYRVLAPDMRWTGSDAEVGYDAATLAEDALGILGACGERCATVAVREAFVRACTGPAAPRRAFSYYRALPESARQLEAATRVHRLTVPTLAVGAHPVGDALARQLSPFTDELTSYVIEDCGHIIPLDRPEALLSVLEPFLAR